MGYIEMSGDVVGEGLPHQDEWKYGNIVQCSRACDEHRQCNSFLFGKWGLWIFNSLKPNQCKLMNEIVPTDPPYGQTTFCAKCNIVTLPFVFVILKETICFKHVIAEWSF